MDIILINNDNIDCLKEFLNNDIPNSFRYLYKRNVSCIKNHIITILVKINNKFVGYAHIDKDDDNYWFGICIISEYQNKGIGNKIMHFIFDNININKILLTVDKSNIHAIKLYKKFNFKIIKEELNYFLMEK